MVKIGQCVPAMTTGSQSHLHLLERIWYISDVQDRELESPSLDYLL